MGEGPKIERAYPRMSIVEAVVAKARGYTRGIRPSLHVRLMRAKRQDGMIDHETPHPATSPVVGDYGNRAGILVAIPRKP